MASPSAASSPERPDPGRTSLVQVEIGGRRYDARYSRSCKCCTHPARMAIEQRLVEGSPYPQIAREFSEVEYRAGGRDMLLPKISWGSIRDHYLHGHMPVNAAAVVELARQRAEELGKDYESMTARIVDQFLVARTVLTKGHEAIANGTLQPDVKDTLAAAKLLQDFEQASKLNVDAEAWTEAFEIYFTTARQIMSDEDWAKFARRLSINPILKTLAAKIANQGEQETLDAEVVETENT